MEHNELLTKINNLSEKLNKAQRQVAAFKAKSKVLEDQYEDSRNRENNTTQLVMELLERQRELNVMLNRANIMLHRTHEAMALSSAELNEMAKALPEPKKAEWADRVAKINDLFTKTGIDDAEISTPGAGIPSLSESLSNKELREESERAFGNRDSIWNRTERREPPRVEVEVVDSEETPGSGSESAPLDCEATVTDVAPGDGDIEAEDDASSRKKSWWQKIAG